MTKNSSEKASYLIVELLESFSTKELSGLQKIVSCTYFNTDRYVVRLLEVLIKKILLKTTINKEIQLRVYNQVFSDLPYVKNELNQKQKAILRSKISALTRLAERFITIEALEQSDLHQYDLMLNALVNKKQFRLFKKNIKKVEKISEGKNDDFDLKHIVEEQRFNYLFKSGQWLKEDNINEIMKNLDLRYLSSRILNTANALSFQTRKPQHNYDFSILELVDNKTFKKYLNGDYPLLILQISSIQLSLQQSLESYDNFMELLEQYEAIISKEDLKGYYTVASNFCSRMEKKGQLNFYEKHVEIFKKMDEKELLTMNSIILKNIVLVGCKAKEFKWVYMMIHKYVPNIDKKHKENIEKFNFGYLAFQQKKYEEAIDYLLEVNNFQKSYDIDKRVLILKSYYELEKYYTEPTAQLFRSIEAFVLNNKQYTEVDKKVYKNTIRIFYNLYRCKHGVGKMTLDKLQQQVEQADYIGSKAWLLEKIEELRK